MDLSTKDITKLRAAGLLNENEIAKYEGNVIVAEHIISRMRRIVPTGGLMLECTRQVLRG